MRLRAVLFALTLASAVLPAAAADTVVSSSSGSGGRNLRPFAVADNWELQWDASGALFQAFLYDAATDQVIGIIANQPKGGPGASYQRKGGRFYLQINALGDWTIKVVQIDK